MFSETVWLLDSGHLFTVTDILNGSSASIIEKVGMQVKQNLESNKRIFCRRANSFWNKIGENLNEKKTAVAIFGLKVKLRVSSKLIETSVDLIVVSTVLIDDATNEFERTDKKKLSIGRDFVQSRRKMNRRKFDSHLKSSIFITLLLIFIVFAEPIRSALIRSKKTAKRSSSLEFEASFLFFCF